jgi:hypothetical protein
MDKQAAIAKATDAVNAHHAAWPNTTAQQATDVAQARNAAFAAGATDDDLVTSWAKTQD